MKMAGGALMLVAASDRRDHAMLKVRRGATGKMAPLNLNRTDHARLKLCFWH